MIRYCGGFLNAMDEANEGAPVFAKVTFDMYIMVEFMYRVSCYKKVTPSWIVDDDNIYNGQN